MPTLLLALLLQAAPPSLSDQFRAEPPSHLFLAVELHGGDVVRAEGPPGFEDLPEPPGEAGHLLLALTGLEEERLDPERRIACDSTCWAGGAHGEPSLIEAVAVGCDRWFADAAARVPEEDVVERAVAAGFSRAPDTPGGWSATAREWTDFWRAMSAGRLKLRATTTATLLSAAGLTVSSPRGLGRPLHDPRRQIRAIVGASDQGAWVTGTVRKGQDVAWAFALFVPRATVPLAVARASSLLDETLRFRDHAVSERGSPLTPFDEDR